MNKVKQITLRDRIRAAFAAFKDGKPRHAIHLGLDVKRCDKCEYKESPRLEIVRPCDERKDPLLTVSGRVNFYNGLEDAEAKVASLIGQQLLRDGCILFKEDALEMALIGKVYVLKPGE